MGTKVVVAMSGGVDSSVAAALLQQQGHEVIGMMLRLWSEPGKENSNRCCSPDSMAQARRVAAKLDMPFYAVDAKEVFYASVVQPFLKGYAEGMTPNPCVTCNREIKWKILFEHACALGADYLATGHYARTGLDDQGRYTLLRSGDPSKDQSYALYTLTQAKLERALFPVGEYSKSEIRRIAGQFGLSTASRPESQDLCFLAGEDYRAFLRRNDPDVAQPGNIVDSEGNVLGVHDGLAFYTIGQRKGLGLATPMPYYVIGKKIGSNELVVGPEKDLGRKELRAVEVNWIAGQTPPASFRVQVKIRYAARPAWATVTPVGPGEALVYFDEPIRDITPGQSAVFYDGDQLLGGGIISD